ncbi:lactonase, 7-bladed beta-propeller [mine drainage metagenome]|uniref:Lactonase, 7-bladed beta-propeller n=1 Tax=mine drainage metagenome TaxID=410659 RepID=A0A1J5TPK8_9ZZZZ
MSRESPKTYFRIVVLLMVLPFSAFAGSKGIAYVSDQEGAVTVVDLETMEIKGVLDIDAKGPRGIGVTEDGKWLVTANKDDGNISVIDTATGRLVKHVVIGKNPEFVRVRGDIAFVTFEPSFKAGKIPQQGSMDKRETGGDDKVPGHVAVVNLTTGKILVDIVGRPETEGVEISKDGNQIIVANESDNSISVHDVNSGKLLKNISLSQYGERPRGIKLSPDGSVYVTTLEFSAKLLVLDKNFELIKEVATGKTPYGVSFDYDGKRVFVATNKEKALQVFDAKTWAKIKDIPTGDRCWHFTFTPDNQQILLACGKSNEILVIDANRLEVTKQISDSGMPWGIVTFPKSMGSLDRP